MKQSYTFLLLLFGLFSCADKESDITTIGEASTAQVIEMTELNTTPTVDLTKYKLINNNQEDRRKDAMDILAIKRRWPLAMQSKKPADFDSILGAGFTYKDHEFFYNRKDYIESRTKPDEWIITHVKYDNVTLQFTGQAGILTYRNRVTNRSLKTGEIEYERIAWMDIFEKENGAWKIAAAHAIDYQLEIPATPQ